VATWDLGHGGGAILGAVCIIDSINSFARGDVVAGPVSCVVLQPILRMVSQPHFNFSTNYTTTRLVSYNCQYRPPPSYEARVVAAAVATGGLVVVMISSVGLVQAWHHRLFVLNRRRSYSPVGFAVSFFRMHRTSSPFNPHVGRCSCGRIQQRRHTAVVSFWLNSFVARRPLVRVIFCCNPFPAIIMCLCSRGR
jgi:hypothetical protein